MYTEDFILRQINIAVAILRQLLRLKEAGEHRKAQESVDQALETLLGLRASLLKQLDDRQILNMLITQDQLDTERLALVAELYKEEGELLILQGQEQDGKIAFHRALRFYLEAALAEPEQLGMTMLGKVWSLYTKETPANLPVETQMALLDYLELLRGRTDTELAAGGTNRQALEDSISELETLLNHSLD